MGGVDLNDYSESRYSPCRVTHKLWRKLAMYLIGTAITNGYIIHRIAMKGKARESKGAHFQFREKLANTMMCLCDTRPRTNTTGVRRPVAVGLGHLPRPYPTLPSAFQHKGEPPRPALRCQIPGCKKKLIFYCAECNKCLCIKGHLMCFSDYHEQLKHLEVPQQQLEKGGEAERTALSSASPSDSNDDDR